MVRGMTEIRLIMSLMIIEAGQWVHGDPFVC